MSTINNNHLIHTKVFTLLLCALLFLPCFAFASTTPAPLNSNADTDSGSDNRPQITTDGAGTWIAVWYSLDTLGVPAIGGDADIFCSISLDDGANWSAPSTLNNNADIDSGQDTQPQLTTDGAGTWIATWQSDDTLEESIGSDDDILFAISVNDGDTWTDPAPLNTNAATDNDTVDNGIIDDDFDPQITTDGSTWIATWDSVGDDIIGPSIGPDGDILYAISDDSGATWSVPKALNQNAASDDGDDSFAQLTTDGTTWIAVWESAATLGDLEADWDILFAVSSDSGASWSGPDILNTNAADDSGLDIDAQLTTDGAGTWIATWSSTDDLNGTIGGDTDILYSISVNNGGSWSPPRQLNANAYNDDADKEDLNPQITTDNAGTWVATWWSISDSTDGDIKYAMSLDNGATWSVVGTLNTNADTDIDLDTLIQLTTDGTTWIAAWESFDWLEDTIGVDADILYCIFDPIVPIEYIWVDFDAGSGGDGTEETPYNNMDSGVTNITIGGRMRIVGGIIDVPYTIDKQFSIE